MGYVVGHSKSNVSKTRRRGNVTIGVDADGYDKTSVSGLYAGVAPVAGKHNIVRTFEGGDPDFYSLSNSELLNFVNGLGERNLTHKTPSQSGWNGSYSLTDNDTRTFRLTTQQNNAATTSAWRTWYWDVSDYEGQTVAISADVEFVSETNCTFLSMTIGQGNTGQFTTHIAGSDAADRITVNTKPTNSIRMEWSGSINATGIVGFTQWINNVTANGANAIIEVSNVQIEVNGHVTEYSNPDKIVTSVNQAKDYLSKRSDTFFFDDIPDDSETDGLILELDASSLSSYPGTGSTWYDLSGNGADAEAVNMPDYNSNGYFTFSGDDEFHSVNISQEYRDLILILKTTKASGLHMVFGRHDNQDDSLRFEGPYIRTSDNIDSNDWHYGSVSDVFINGEFDAVADNNIALNNKFHFLRAYRSNNSGFGSSFRYEISSAFLSNRYFEGELAYIAAYNRKLSESEVLQTYYGGDIVTNGLTLSIDPGNLVSYEKDDTLTYNLTGSISGSVINGLTILNQNGGVFDFDGASDLIRFGNQPSMLTNDITQEAWVNTDTMVNWHGIITNMDGWGTGFSLQIGPTQNIAAMVSGNYLKTSWTPSIGVWYHIVATHRSSDNYNALYVNGNLENTMTRAISYDGGDVIDIGCFYTGGSLRFNGQMGPVRTYNRALSADEVLQNYNAQKARFI
jgi:hypothetical protein